MNAYRLTTAHLSERELRCAWVVQLEREIAAGMAFLGISPAPQVEDEDALLAELLS